MSSLFQERRRRTKETRRRRKTEKVTGEWSWEAITVWETKTDRTRVSTGPIVGTEWSAVVVF